MKAALNYITFLIYTFFTFNFIYKSVFAGNSSRPVTFQIIPEWLRLSCSLKRSSFNFVQ